MWLGAIEKGALAAPTPSKAELRAANQDADTLIIAVAENIDTWDPGFTVGSKSSQTTIQNTFDQLTQYTIVDATAPDGTPYKTVDTTKIIGMIASDIATDGGNMTFTLGNNALYHNGDPVDACDEGRLRPEHGVGRHFVGAAGDGRRHHRPGEFHRERGRHLYHRDGRTERADSAKQCDAQHGRARSQTDGRSRHGIRSLALDYFRTNLGVGNGPYKLDSYKPDDAIVLVAADNYYGEAPFFKKVIMKIVADATQRVQLLKNNDIDTATKIPFSEYQGLSTNENIKTLSIPSNLVVLIEMNTTIAPFDQKEVRQAVAYATPYADIIEQVYLGQAGEAKSLLPSGMPSFDPSTYEYTLDLEKAAALLEAAGYPNGEGLPDITYTISADDQQKERIAIIMQDSLKKIGMNVQIQKLAYAQFNELEQGSKLQIWGDEWISWVNDPFYHLTWPHNRPARPITRNSAIPRR